MWAKNSQHSCVLQALKREEPKHSLLCVHLTTGKTPQAWVSPNGAFPCCMGQRMGHACHGAGPATLPQGIKTGLHIRVNYWVEGCGVVPCNAHPQMPVVVRGWANHLVARPVEVTLQCHKVERWVASEPTELRFDRVHADDFCSLRRQASANAQETQLSNQHLRLRPSWVLVLYTGCYIGVEEEDPSWETRT